MNEPAVPVPKRVEVGKWLLTITQARYPVHAGVFLFNDGSVEFWDIFSYRLMFELFHVGDGWLHYFWCHDLFEEYGVGEDAERSCMVSRRIVITDEVKRWILRANRRNLHSVDNGDGLEHSLAWMINNHLEVQYWMEIAQYLIYLPFKRENNKVPLLPFPVSYSDVIVNVPVDMPKPWWES